MRQPVLKRIEDQVIVITGASSGIGLVTARLAAARGAAVVLAARSADGLWQAAEAIRARGGEVASVVADVASELIHDRAPVSVTLIKPTGIDTPYAHHAQNYLPMQRKNPPPLYAPEVVARAILHAAQHPVRDLTVGGSGRMLEALDRWLPGLTDRVMARVLPSVQQCRTPAGERGPAGLYAASGEARERSGDASFVRERSAYTAAARHPFVALGIVVAAGAGLALLARNAPRR